MIEWIGHWLYRHHMWFFYRQRNCPHPAHRNRNIYGDERLYGYHHQCMECGKLFK